MKLATAKLRGAILPAFLLLACAPVAFASDVTGKWTGDFAAGDGNTYTLKFTFTQAGTKVTGSAETPHGSFDISDGKVDGDKIWFTVKMDEMTVKHEGTVKEDEIKLQVAFDGGGEAPGPLTLKRVK